MDMKTRFFLRLSLLLFLLASACAPAPAPTEVEATQAILIQPSEATTTLAAPPVVDPAATQPSVVDAQPIATSRGPNLEATDPSTVSLANGGVQLVEFFRFT